MIWLTLEFRVVMSSSEQVVVSSIILTWVQRGLFILSSDHFYR